MRGNLISLVRISSPWKIREKEKKKKKKFQLTGDAGAESDEGNRGDRVLDAQGAAKVGRHVSNYRRHHADPEYADDKAQVTTGDIWKIRYNPV